MQNYSQAIKANYDLKLLASNYLAMIMTVLVFFTLNVSAQTPYKMSYQAIIRDNSNALIINSVIGMRISILPNTPNGLPVYAESQITTTNDNGLVSIEIGSGTVLNGNLSTINWSNGPYYVRTETDPSGGTNYSIAGTNQILSVPYALYSLNAGSITGGSNVHHYIGEHFGGGLIFHLWKDTLGIEHGLIVDLVEIGINIPWSNVTNTLIGPSAQSEWDGLSNSLAIVGQIGHTNSAAAICLNSTNGGQNDWYLPSYHELFLLWLNNYTLSITLTQISGAMDFNNSSYWSSTEYNADNAYGLTMSSLPEFHSKNSKPRVRAIRAF